MRQTKMVEWMENVEKAISRIMADKVYTSAEFKRERDNFHVRFLSLLPPCGASRVFSVRKMDPGLIGYFFRILLGGQFLMVLFDSTYFLMVLLESTYFLDGTF